jgi:F-type H+-transporting ATPase subunit b
MKQGAFRQVRSFDVVSTLRLMVMASLVFALGVCPALSVSARAADDHGGAHEHIGHANAGDELDSPLEWKSDLAFFTFVVFLLLLAILGKFAWGPIVTSLEKREQSIADHIAAAERSNLEAKALLAQYEQRLAAAAGEVKALLDDARRDAETTKQSILHEAKAGADAERARATRDIESATDQALETIAQRSAQLAVDLAGKVLKSKLSPDDHARLVQEAMQNLPSAAASTN